MSISNIETNRLFFGFDESAYLEANVDIANAVKIGKFTSGFDQWKKYGAAEKRAIHAIDSRKYKIFHSINQLGKGLEIGPSHCPIAAKREGYDVQIVDHATADQLREKYKSSGLALENIEDVDFVWQGQPLTELVGSSECYDFIIASHVIEHIPDLIGFLQDCNKLLKPNGVISLAIPDKRYCFDYFGTLTSTGDLLDAHQKQQVRPSAGQIFDYLANFCVRQGSIAWAQDTPGNFTLVHEIAQAQDAWQLASMNDAYVDVHCWRFTPSSFELIIQDLQQLKLLTVGYEVSFDTSGCEFFVSLGKKTHCPASEFKSRLNLLEAIQRECLRQ
jgi:predicted SAM-dependent methyltransferase